MGNFLEEEVFYFAKLWLTRVQEEAEMMVPTERWLNIVDTRLLVVLHNKPICSLS